MIWLARTPNSVINLLISVQNELIWRANSPSKTWVKYFYVFGLARGSYSTAQWTKSLSGTNNPPTLSSTASLWRRQVHWVYVLWGYPSSEWLACWLIEHWSLWSPLLMVTLLLTASQVTHSEAMGRDTQDPETTVSLYHQWWKRHTLLAVLRIFLFKLQTWIAFLSCQFLYLQLWLNACVMSVRTHRLSGVECVYETVIIFFFWGVSAKYSSGQLHLCINIWGSCELLYSLSSHLVSFCLCLYLSTKQCE